VLTCAKVYSIHMVMDLKVTNVKLKRAPESVFFWGDEQIANISALIYYI